MKQTQKGSALSANAGSLKLLGLILLISAFFAVSVTYAFFSSSSSKSGSFVFANIELNILHSNNSSATNETFQATLPENLTPGDILTFNNLKIKASADSDLYTLVKLDVIVNKTDTTKVTHSVWYNLEGKSLIAENINSNSLPASLVRSKESVITDFSYVFDGNIYDNSYKRATVDVKFSAYGVQTVLPTATVSKEMFASYLIYKDAGASVTQPVLPTKYTALEYLESNGTQYIDLDYVLTSNNFEVNMTAQYTGITSNVHETYFGFMGNGSLPSIGIHNYTGYYMYGADTTKTTTFAVDDKMHTFRMIGVGGYKQSLYIDEYQSVLDSTGYNFSANTLSTYLFARNYQRSDKEITARIYSFNLFVNGVLVKNLVPAMDNLTGEYGMYDFVNEEFLTKGAGDDFTTGGYRGVPINYTSLKYIQADGNSAIDLGYSVPTNHAVDLIASFSKNSPTKALWGAIDGSSYTDDNYSFTYAGGTSYCIYAHEAGSSSPVVSTGNIVADKRVIYGTDGKGTFYINNSSATISGFTHFTLATSTWILGRNQMSGDVYAESGSRVYLYKEFDENNNLVKYMVPVKSEDNVYGLFDIITQTFYGGTGTGTLTGA